MRRTPLIALVGATLLALGLVAAITLADGSSSATGDPPPPDGPAVRVAGRAGLVSVGVAARPGSLQLTLIAPEVDGAETELREVRLTTPAGATTILETRPCGATCHLASADLEPGVSALRVSTAFAGHPGAVTLRIPHPAPDARAVLREAVAATGRLAQVTVRERLTSDTNGRFVTNDPVRVSGSVLIATYAADFARDVRELPSSGGLRRIAFALPDAQMWFELWVRPDGTIIRDRITGPNHLILRTIAPE